MGEFVTNFYWFYFNFSTLSLASILFSIKITFISGQNLNSSRCPDAYDQYGRSFRFA
jgi:hypothetical protein